MLSTKERPNQDPHNRDVTLGARGRFFLVFGFSVFIAAIGPSAHFAEVLSTFLLFGAVIMVIGAKLKGDKLVSKNLTEWDVSAALVVFGLLARLLVKV